MLEQRIIYSIGHSNHVTAAFVGLLRQHGIERLVDVRSQPYSRWNPQFNRDNLAANLQEAGIDYVFMGDSLGGRPQQATLYERKSERPNYDLQAETPLYQQGVARLRQLAGERKTAMMCSEGDPDTCHRKLLITETLLQGGDKVQHILPDGTLRRAEPEARQLEFNF
jgi:uncharacterized protein (DUF488 family)